jgi:sugar/nucleoside kinase (ribokinase family)
VSWPGPSLTIRESMTLVESVRDGPLHAATTVRLRFGGVESNFAIAIARLGGRARWISRLGTDPFGAMIVSQLHEEAVDVSCVQFTDAVCPTSPAHFRRGVARVNARHATHARRSSWYRIAEC